MWVPLLLCCYDDVTIYGKHLLAWSRYLFTGLVSIFIYWLGLDIYLLAWSRYLFTGLVSIFIYWLGLDIYLLAWSRYLFTGLVSIFIFWKNSWTMFLSLCLTSSTLVPSSPNPWIIKFFVRFSFACSSTSSSFFPSWRIDRRSGTPLNASAWKVSSANYEGQTPKELKLRVK